MSVKPPTENDLKAVGIGSVLVLKRLHMRWNELVGSRWIVVSITKGITRQTKITPEEKYLDPSDATVYHLRPLLPRHGHFPTGQPNVWEISDGTRKEQFEPFIYRTIEDAGPFF